MIKKSFKDFILMLEASSSQSSLDNDTLEYNTGLWTKNKEFLHKFHGALEELPGTSWTRIASSGRNAVTSEDVWYEIDNSLKNFDLTWEDVKSNKEVILDNIDCYSSLNAYVDIILYNLDKNYNVGGWNEDSATDSSEVVIKYRYGYHQTTYGIIFINRYFGGVENFIDNVAQNLIELFIEDSRCIDFKWSVDVLTEIENSFITSWKDNVLSIKIEYLYLIVSPYLKDLKGLKNFRDFFIGWVSDLNPSLDIDYDDEEELILIDFSGDL
jgi:hypothetical protein